VVKRLTDLGAEFVTMRCEPGGGVQSDFCDIAWLQRAFADFVHDNANAGR